MKLDSGKLEEKLKAHPYVLFASKSLRRILTGDIDYVNFAIEEYSNPKRLSIKTYGDENRGKIIYCIKEQGMGYGFFAEFLSLLHNLVFAEEMGLVPHVTWGNGHLYYDEDISFTDNVYEYYFEPIKIEDLYRSKNVCFSTVYQNEYISNEYNITAYASNDDYEQKLMQVIQKYIRLRSELLNEFDKDVEKILGNHKILGIHHRGTDYKKGYNCHPVMVSVEQGIKQAERMLNQYKLDGIFLATDDQEILEQYIDYFGNKINFFSDVIRGSSDVSIAFAEKPRKCHHYNLGKEVLRDVYLLSKCACLLSGKSRVSFFANVFNQLNEKHYLEYQLLDNGMNKSRVYFNA
ncbi:MAG: hypothetical protein HFI50_03820 [Lachnospiraceae bacterium]|nr:hypothetical protein [Lachnospiraceae bacterium]